MAFLRKLGAFWLILLLMALLGYFCAYNLDWTVVTVPQVGQVRVRAAIAYAVAFLVGALLTILFFGIDVAKKSLEVRRLVKRNRELESQLVARDASAYRPSGSTVPTTASRPETAEPRFDMTT